MFKTVTISYLLFDKKWNCSGDGDLAYYMALVKWGNYYKVPGLGPDEDIFSNISWKH